MVEEIKAKDLNTDTFITTQIAEIKAAVGSGNGMREVKCDFGNQVEVRCWNQPLRRCRDVRPW